MSDQFICKFACDDKTFFWGPFATEKEAKQYERNAKKQARDYYGKDIAVRTIEILSEPLP